MSAGESPRFATGAIPKAAQELSVAASAVHTAAQVSSDLCVHAYAADPLIIPQAMVNNKEAWRKVSKIVRQIDTCVETSARTAHHRGERADLPVVVTAALGATRECVLSIN